MEEKSIFCIDDDPHVVRSITRVLELAGYNVDSTSLESASIEILKLNRPGLVLLDISMPSISGLKILEKIRSTPSLAGLPVIIVSGKDDPKTVRDARELGANDFISKPFEPSHLLKSIRNFINSDLSPTRTTNFSHRGGDH